MVDYKKKQEEGFSELKKILQEKGETETIQGCEVRMELVHFGGVELGDDPLHGTETERQRAGKLHTPAYEAC